MPMTKKSLIIFFVLLHSLTACVFDDINHEPSANSFELAQSNGLDSVTIEASQILENTNDSDGDTLTITDVQVIRGDGELIESGENWLYTPSLTDVGEINIQFTVSDGEFEISANISFEIVNASRVKVSDSGFVSLSVELDDANGALSNTSFNVMLTVNGADYDVTSLGALATFIKLPSNVPYLITVSDPSNALTTEYFAGQTPAVNEFLIDNVTVPMPTATVTTHLFITDVNTNQAIAGLKPYYQVNQVTASNDQNISFDLGKVYGEFDGEGYAFALSANNSYSIILDDLTNTAEIQYSLFDPNITLPNLTDLSAGQDTTIELMSDTNNASYQIVYALNNELNEAYSVGSILKVYNIDNDVVENWRQVADTSNHYSFDVNNESMPNARVIMPLDIDNDGFTDQLATVPQSYPLGLSDKLTPHLFDQDKSLEIPVTIADIPQDSAIYSKVISQTSDFQANNKAKVFIAFDRPIQSPQSISLARHGLSTEQVLIDLESEALIYQADKTTTATTDQGESSLILSSSNTYTYLDVNGSTVVLSAGVENSDQIVSPFTTKLVKNKSTRTLSQEEFELVADGTLLVITLNPAELVDDNLYTFSTTVDNLFDNAGAAAVQHSLYATSNISSNLNELSLDNFDFMDTGTFDPVTPANLQPLENQVTHQDLFAELNVGYNAGATNDNAQLRYALYQDHGQPTFAQLNTSGGLTSNANTLFLISKAPITGGIEVLQQTETDVSAGVAVNTNVDITNTKFNLYLSSEAPAAEEGIQLSQGIKVYLFDEPSNHSINGSAIEDTFNAKTASGALIEETGIYYVYPLNLTLQTSGQITKAKLEFEVSINGSLVSGTKEYRVN